MNLTTETPKNETLGIFSTAKDVALNSLSTAKEATELVATATKTARKGVDLANNLMDEIIVIQKLEAINNIATAGNVTVEVAAQMLIAQQSN